MKMNEMTQRLLRIIPILFVCCGGCAEMVAIGSISDRESSGTVNDVTIQASTDGKNWKKLGTTDGGGEYWILKSEIPANSQLRLTKRGYHPLKLSDQEFLASRSHLMAPTGTASADPFDDQSKTATIDPFEESEPPATAR